MTNPNSAKARAREWPRCRRTHSIHHDRADAVQAARDLAFLTNGVPFGFVFGVQPKMGKWAFVSYPRGAA